MIRCLQNIVKRCMSEIGLPPTAGGQGLPPARRRVYHSCRLSVWTQDWMNNLSSFHYSLLFCRLISPPSPEEEVCCQWFSLLTGPRLFHSFSERQLLLNDSYSQLTRGGDFLTVSACQVRLFVVLRSPHCEVFAFSLWAGLIPFKMIIFYLQIGIYGLFLNNSSSCFRICDAYLRNRIIKNILFKKIF